MTHYTQPDELIELPCLKMALSVQDIYDSVEVSEHQFNDKME